jgi:electron transfer flavoprotein alpha subunit
VKVLVLVEWEDDAVGELSRQALTLAASIGDVSVACVEPAPEGHSFPLWEIRHPLLTDYAPEAIGTALAQLVEREDFAVLVAAGSERGNEVMAHVAAILDLPQATNVTEVVTDASDWRVRRVRWGGSLLEDAHLSATVKLLTAAPHSFPPHELSSSTAPVQVFEPELAADLARTRVVERIKTTEGITLTTAPVVVSGGRGVGSPEGFGTLEELARLIGGAVGCSRVVTNNGWRPHSDQVGQTGTRVAPTLYIACGISGAIQHWVGMMASKNVLAINNDADAPMVTKADYAVIGDLHPILEAIVAEVKRRKGL